MGPGPTAGADMIYTGKQAMLFGGTGGIAMLSYLVASQIRNRIYNIIFKK
jgi:hypothetical protein